jgi:hypothetical protein
MPFDKRNERRYLWVMRGWAALGLAIYVGATVLAIMGV